MAAHLVWRPSKRKEADVAYLRFWLGDRKFFRSLKTTDKTIANAKLWRANETLRRQEQGDLAIPEGATFDEAFDFIVSGGKQIAAPELVADVTLEQIKKNYFDELPKGAKEDSSVATEKTHAGHFIRILGGSVPIRSLGVSQLQRYVSDRRKDDGQRGKKIQPHTIKKELQTFKQLWDLARVRQYVEGDCPTLHVRLPKPDQKPPFQTWAQIEAAVKKGGLTALQIEELWDSLFLGEKEVQGLLAWVKKNAEHPFIYAMFAFTAFTGARRSEVIRSQVRDFQPENGLVLIREKKRRQKVSISFRRVQLHAQLKEIMAEWFRIHPGGPFTICTPPHFEPSKNKSESPQPLTESQAHDHFQRALADSKWKVVRGFHVLRHSLASICAQKGIHQSIIDSWLGHQTEEMRNRHRHLFPEETRKAMDRVLTSDIGTLFGREAVGEKVEK
ncbi:MAG: site-specific integrase [Thermoguttaceae bacterium]